MEEVSAQTEELRVYHRQEQPLKQRWLLVLLILFFLFLLGLTVVFIRQRTTLFGRKPAQPVISEVSIENSYLFASPLSAKADGKQKIRATIYVLDSQGLGVLGQPVFLGQDERLEIIPVQALTDNFGRAIFDIASTSPSEYHLEAKVGNQVLPQRVKVSFR